MAVKRRFPPPWRVEELESCYLVLDGSGRRLAYVYFDERPITHTTGDPLTKDEARRIAANIARVPEWAGQKTS